MDSLHHTIYLITFLVSRLNPIKLLSCLQYFLEKEAWFSIFLWHTLEYFLLDCSNACLAFMSNLLSHQVHVATHSWQTRLYHLLRPNCRILHTRYAFTRAKEIARESDSAGKGLWWCQNCRRELIKQIRKGKFCKWLLMTTKILWSNSIWLNFLFLHFNFFFF